MNPPYRVVAFSRNRNWTFPEYQERAPSTHVPKALFLLNYFAVPALSSTFPGVRGFKWLGLGGYNACIIIVLISASLVCVICIYQSLELSHAFYLSLTYTRTYISIMPEYHWWCSWRWLSNSFWCSTKIVSCKSFWIIDCRLHRWGGYQRC